MTRATIGGALLLLQATHLAAAPMTQGIPRQPVPAPGRAPAAAACPRTTDRETAEAWRLFRRDSVAAAGTRFEAIRRGCPTAIDAELGAAFVFLRQGALDRADSLFTDVTTRVPTYADAWDGLGTVRNRQGRLADAERAWRTALQVEPRHAGARAALDRLRPDWDRTATTGTRRRAATLDLTLRVAGEGFELRRGGTWQPFYVRGVNIGAALPGRFPSEPPEDSATYARWFKQIGAMHANTLRVYTVLPPAFYRALRAYNLAAGDAPLYVMHGVWTELPPRYDFADSAFNAEFAQEIRDVVDLLHGAAEVRRRPGHSGGRYDADISPWTIGYILGREWEPFAVTGFNEDPHAARQYAGRHLVIPQGTPTDIWMVRQCDFLLSYEEDTYNAQRPIAYTNWPTTDALRHPSEVTYEQEMAFRGLKFERAADAEPTHEQEVVTLDPMLAHPTPHNVAGWFASYHVYPYYPDFMLYDPGYLTAASSLGRSNYFGYLRDLKRVHPGIPLLISEFGVPSSRGMAHLQPQGWNHGGLSEAEQAEITVRMAKEIREAGAAGSIVFAWMDEWFKWNWFSGEFERPQDRARLWHNMLSPEQHYGVLALRPGPAERTPLPGGALAPWRGLRVLQRGRLGADSAVVRIGGDEGFVYIAIEAPAWKDTPLDWSRWHFQIAIDTHAPDAGQLVLPTTGLRSGIGFEYLVSLDAPDDAQLLVTPDYNPFMPHRLVQGGLNFGAPFRRPVRSVARVDGVFDSLYTMTNRARFASDGTPIRAAGVNMGRLRYGRAADHSLADWWYDPAGGMLQLRLPWAMLNVSDPSSRRVLAEPVGGGPTAPLTGVVTEGFRVGVVAWRPGPDLLGTIPALDPYGIWPGGSFVTWTWDRWETPTWHEYLKPVYFALQRLWATP